MAAKRRHSPRAGRTTTAARSGTRRAKRQSDSKPRKKLAPPLPSPVEVASKRLKPTVEVHGPFYAQAYRAYKVEYSEWTGTEWWTSAFYCEHEATAQLLAGEARKVKDRAGWKRLHNKAKEIATEESNGFLYRIMVGQPIEVYRAEKEKPKVYGY